MAGREARQTARFNFFLEPELMAAVNEAVKSLGYKSAADYVRDCVSRGVRQDGFVEGASDDGVSLSCPHCRRKVTVKLS